MRISSERSAVVNGPRKNSPAGIVRSPSGPSDGQLGVHGQDDGGQLGSRVGVRDAAAHGAAVADRRVRDVPEGLGQQRSAEPDFR